MNRLRVSPLNLRPPIRFNPWFRQITHGAPLEHKAQTYRPAIDITLLWSERQNRIPLARQFWSQWGSVMVF